MRNADYFTPTGYSEFRISNSAFRIPQNIGTFMYHKKM